MKKIVFALLILASCAKEDSVGTAPATTFVRYFNGGNSDEAKAIVETADKGLLILANTEITQVGVNSIYKIKLIKTDAYGNLVWQKLYPEITNTTTSYKGNGLAIDPAGGYVIVGEDIDTQTGFSKLLIITLQEDGNYKGKAKTMTSALQVKGMGVGFISAADAPNSPNPPRFGNYMILSSQSDPSNNMMLAEFSKAAITDQTSTATPLWSQKFGAGESVNITNKLFVDENSNSFWGGTVKKANDQSNIRLIKVPTNSTGVLYDFTPSSNFTETANDIYLIGANVFLLVGKSNSTTPTTTGAHNISLKRYLGANQIYSTSYPFPAQDGDANGNGIAPTKDGGFILLGTAKLAGIAGRGETDYCLVKVDDSGKQLWTKNYGSKYEDVGVSIITTTDGGHVVLGTTNLANTKSILVMKTDRNGNIE